MAKTTSVSLDALNIKAKCEDAINVPYLDESGQETGIVLKVIGAHAQKVQEFVNRKMNERRRQEAMQAKRGKADEVRKIEDDIEFGVQFISMRIVGWTGITEECTPDNALKLCQINPQVIEQVKEASENLANFTKNSKSA